MRLTRQTGLIVIVGLAILGGVLVATSGAIADARISSSLLAIRELYLPKMKLGPRLEAQLERIRRGFQDAVAAQDQEALNITHLWLDEVSELVAASQPSLTSSDAGAIRKAFKTYYAAGLAVSRRLMHAETGELLLQDIKEMQEREKATSELIAGITAVDPERLDQAFADIVRAQAMVARVRLGIIVGFLTVIAVIAVFLARHLRAEEKRREQQMRRASHELEVLSAPSNGPSEPLDLAELARDCASLVRQSHAGRVVELSVADALPVMIEPGLARLLIVVLLEHAWNMTARAPAARVEVGSAIAAGEVCFFVRNNGAGIDPPTARNLFSSSTGFGNPQVDRSGLATAQRVVRRCGGRIWAETSSGAGLTINFTLPARQNRAG